MVGTILDPRTTERVEQALTKRDLDARSVVFKVILLASSGFALLILTVLLVDIMSGGLGVLTDRFSTFIGNAARTQPGEAGVFQGIRGTFWIGVFVVLLSFPLGIGAAIYLEEYTPDNRLTRFIDLNIRNLAGVPSVVYGILGLAIFVKLLDGFYPGSRSDHLGSTTMVGGVTLAVLVLPIVIITSAEAIRAVPQSLREAGYGVGATRWEVIRSLVIPYASPGILTGTLLSLARALGEAAPLILVGAVQGAVGGDTGLLDPSQLGERFTALPIVITSFAQKPRGSGWEEVTAAAIIVLLLIVLAANSVAIVLRNRFEKKRRG